MDKAELIRRLMIAQDHPETLPLIIHDVMDSHVEITHLVSHNKKFRVGDWITLHYNDCKAWRINEIAPNGKMKIGDYSDCQWVYEEDLSLNLLPVNILGYKMFKVGDEVKTIDNHSGIITGHGMFGTLFIKGSSFPYFPWQLSRITCGEEE